jgi:hypothetical protein
MDKGSRCRQAASFCVIHRQRCGAVCVTRTEVNVRFTSKPTQLLRGNEMTRGQ